MIQADLAWQDPAANRHRLAAHCRGLAGHTDLIVLPEMFTTGFSMDAATLAETMDGATVGWMREEAAATARPSLALRSTCCVGVRARSPASAIGTL